MGGEISVINKEGEGSVSIFKFEINCVLGDDYFLEYEEQFNKIKYMKSKFDLLI